MMQKSLQTKLSSGTMGAGFFFFRKVYSNFSIDKPFQDQLKSFPFENEVREGKVVLKNRS